MFIRYTKDSLKFLNRLDLVKKLILAWDPDFTKVTEEEAKLISAAENSGFVSDSEIDWDSIGVD